MPKRTPLYEEHLALGARMTVFADWEMPLCYEPGPIAEHLNVRQKAGLFDISHMGRIMVSGPNGQDLLQFLATSNIARLREGTAGYAPLCYADGGLVDDAFIYHLPGERYLVVVNAANTQKDLQWFEYHQRGYDVVVQDISTETCMLAIQGPQAEEILQTLTSFPLKRLGFHEVVETSIAGTEMIVGRTGYTGEDGFELYFKAEAALPVWRTLLEAGKPKGLLPIGLAARDSLRFEPCLPLYGHELGPDITPLQAGLGWAVALKKGPFIGREALLKERLEGPARKLIGFEMLEKAIPRQGCPVIIQGAQQGYVTSGMYSPSLEKTLGMAYVPAAYAEIGTEIGIDIRGRIRQARIVPRPFYTPTYRR